MELGLGARRSSFDSSFDIDALQEESMLDMVCGPSAGMGHGITTTHVQC